MDSWRNEARFVLKALQDDEEVLFRGDDEQHTLRAKRDKSVEKWGFSYGDMWDLDKAIAMFILPRLAYYCKHNRGVPCILEKIDDDGNVLNAEGAEQEWNHILETMYDGLHLYIEKDHMDFTDEDKVLWLTTKQYFFDYFEHLWD